MTARFIPLEDRCFGNSRSQNNTLKEQNSTASNRVFRNELNPSKGQNIYDYNPNIPHKVAVNAPAKLTTWNFNENSCESYQTTLSNKDKKPMAAQNSSRNHDVTSNRDQKENQKRSSTVEDLSARNSQPDQRVQLELALYKHKQFLAEQARYRQDLKEQVQEKQRRQYNEKLSDVNSNNSGLVIGEVHEGLDIQRFAKNMKIRENKKATRKSLDRSFTNTERSVSSQSLRDFNNHNGYSSNNHSAACNPYVLSASLIDEKEEEEVEKYSPEFHQRRLNKEKINQNKRGSLQEINENAAELRYQLKKAHHKKLRESLQNELKKHEDYTKKLFSDQRKRKQELNQALDTQTINNQYRRKASEHREKMQEKAHEGFKSVNLQPGDRAWETKSALIADIEKKYKNKLGARQDERLRERAKHTNGDGRFKRLIDDTVKKILAKKDEVVGQNKSDVQESFGNVQVI